MFLYGKKVLYWKFLTEKNFFTEKNINENVKNIISFEKYIFIQKMFVLQTKYKSFINIFILQKNCFWSWKINLLEIRCERNNLVLKVSEVPNLWYSLN